MYFRRKCKITFISHGATIYSEEERFSDALNYPPLSELGQEETENIIKYLKTRGIKNDAIYSSPAVKTVQTADMVSKVFKQDYIVVNELTSRQYADWNGLTYDKIQLKYPGAFEFVMNNPDKLTPGNGESSVDFIKRIKKVIDNIIEENIGNRIIIVTHPEVIQAAICAALDIGADKLPKIYIRTGSATQISYFEHWSSLVYCDHVPI